MSNLQALRDLINPKASEYIGTVTHADHPNYKVLISDNSGLTRCTSNSHYQVGDRVVISAQEIKRPAPTGAVVQIEI